MHDAYVMQLANTGILPIDNVVDSDINQDFEDEQDEFRLADQPNTVLDQYLGEDDAIDIELAVSEPKSSKMGMLTHSM